MQSWDLIWSLSDTRSCLLIAVVYSIPLRIFHETNKLSVVKDGGETLLFPPISWRFKIHTNLLETLGRFTGKKKTYLFLFKPEFTNSFKTQNPSPLLFSLLNTWVIWHDQYFLEHTWAATTLGKSLLFGSQFLYLKNEGLEAFDHKCVMGGLPWWLRL